MMGGRQSTGWGECVECGETLKPEDAERLGWSDRCGFCLTRSNLYHIILERENNAIRNLNEVNTEKWIKENGERAKEHWISILDTYQAMYEPLKRLRTLKTSLWGESY